MTAKTADDDRAGINAGVENLTAPAAFDFARAKAAAEDYSRVAGVGCSILDREGNHLYRAGEGPDPCAGCCRLQQLARRPHNCRDTHLYSIYHAERYGGRYIFFCPISLVHWTSPIVVEGITVGALLGGPVLAVEESDFFEQEFFRLFPEVLPDPAEIRDRFRTVPYVEPARVKSLSEMLYAVSTLLSEGERATLREEYEKMHVDARISEHIHYIKQLERDGEENVTYPVEKESLLLECIRTGNQQEAQKILNEILGYVFFTSGRNLEVIKARVMELTVLLSRAALQGGADNEQIFGLNFRYLQQLYTMHNVDDIAYGLSRIMRRFTDCVFILKDVKHVDVIQRSIAYIKKHHRERIPLEEIAAHVSLSPTYFSRLFREEMKTTFTEFLNRYRITKAKSLLVNSRIPIIEVADLVGFEDQSYFTKVFKKIAGVSPGRFRESGGQMPTAGGGSPEHTMAPEHSPEQNHHDQREDA